MQHIWAAHAGKPSPEALPPQGPHTGSPPRAAALAGPVFRVSPREETERRLEISSSVLFSSKCFFIRFPSLNKAGKAARCCQRLGASLCSARPPCRIPPARDHPSPPLPSPAFPFLTPLKLRNNLLKLGFHFCAGKGNPSLPRVEGGLS